LEYAMTTTLAVALILWAALALALLLSRPPE
jgi:hypothetical protein